MTTDRRRSPSTDRRSRHEHKELTRQAIIRSALRLLSKNSFDSISLREVTREAGISPTAFYRHFDDMEELGLVLVDEVFATLRPSVRLARANPKFVNDAIGASIDMVTGYVRDHEAHMRFIVREGHGGVRRIRRAIERELDLLSDELAVDLAEFAGSRRLSWDDRRMIGGLIVDVVVGLASNLVDSDHSTHAAKAETARKQLRLIALGAASLARRRPPSEDLVEA